MIYGLGIRKICAESEPLGQIQEIFYPRILAAQNNLTWSNWNILNLTMTQIL